MFVCGHVRREREGLLGDLQGEGKYAYVNVYTCIRVCRQWSGSTAGKHKTDAGNNAHPVVAPLRTPHRARKNRNMAVASHALFALLFCTPTIPRTID